MRKDRIKLSLTSQFCLSIEFCVSETSNLEQIVWDSYPHNDSITEDVPLQVLNR